MKMRMIALMGALVLLGTACDKSEEVHDFSKTIELIKNDKSGKVLATTTTYFPQDIEVAVTIAGDLAKGIKPADKRVIVPSKLVTKESIDSYIKPRVKF